MVPTGPAFCGWPLLYVRAEFVVVDPSCGAYTSPLHVLEPGTWRDGFLLQRHRLGELSRKPRTVGNHRILDGKGWQHRTVAGVGRADIPSWMTI
jgi:hypothetical protein